MLNEERIDLLRELFNIGVGRAGAMISELIGTRVTLQVPELGICQLCHIGERMATGTDEEYSAVTQSFSGGMNGSAVLLFLRESGEALAKRLIGDETGQSDIGLEKEGALSEVGNIVINSVLGTVTQLLGGHFTFSLPHYAEGGLATILHTAEQGTVEEKDSPAVIYATASFDIEAFQATGKMLIVFEISSLDVLVAAIDRRLAQPAE